MIQYIKDAKQYMNLSPEKHIPRWNIWWHIHNAKKYVDDITKYSLDSDLLRKNLFFLLLNQNWNMQKLYGSQTRNSLERIQKIATKMVSYLEDLTYKEGL